MNFDLSREQSVAKEAAGRFLRDAYGFDARRRILATDAGISRNLWRRFGEFGWLGLLLLLPLILFHQTQLMVCAMLARHYAAANPLPVARSRGQRSALALTQEAR